MCFLSPKTCVFRNQHNYSIVFTHKICKLHLFLLWSKNISGVHQHICSLHWKHSGGLIRITRGISSFFMTIDYIYPPEINMWPHTVHIHRLSVFQEQNLEFEIHLLFRHRWKVNQLSTTFTDITQRPEFNSIFELHLIYWVNSGQPSSICEPNERYQGRVRSTFKLSITGIYWDLSYGIDYNGAEFAVNCFRHMTQCVLPCSFWL